MDYKKYVAIIEPSTRKKHSLTKKKDLSKITEEEFEILLDIAEDKIQKLEDSFCKTLYNILGTPPQANDIEEKKSLNFFNIFVLDNKIECFINLKVKRLKTSLIITNPVGNYKIIDENFLSRNNEFINPIIGVKEIFNIFEFIHNIFEDLNILILKYTEMDKIIIDKTNVNNFIKDIDNVLKWFFLNPSINSTTSLGSRFLDHLRNTISYFKCNQVKYNIIKEEAYYDITPVENNYKYYSKYELIIKLNDGLFKINISINRAFNTHSLNIYLYKWSDTGGWLFIDKIDNYDKLLSLIDLPNYNIKPNNLDIYKDYSIDICLIEALKYLHKFIGIKGFKPNYIY